jgi:hypothetical protein
MPARGAAILRPVQTLRFDWISLVSKESVLAASTNNNDSECHDFIGEWGGEAARRASLLPGRLRLLNSCVQAIC